MTHKHFDAEHNKAVGQIPTQFSPDSLGLSSILLSDIQKHSHVRIVVSLAAIRLPIDIENMLLTIAINHTVEF